jgi:hypothetical protein
LRILVLLDVILLFIFFLFNLKKASIARLFFIAYVADLEIV